MKLTFHIVPKRSSFKIRRLWLTTPPGQIGYIFYCGKLRAVLLYGGWQVLPGTHKYIDDLPFVK